MQARWIGWWYFAIGAGFALLGVRLLVVGAPFWQPLLRFAVAAGFLLLAWIYLRRAGPSG